MSIRTIPTTYQIASTIATAARRSILNALRTTIDGKTVVVTASACAPAAGQDERETNSVTFAEPRVIRFAKMAPVATGEALECIRQLLGARPE